jgi:AraC-like DNA-binding protein
MRIRVEPTLISAMLFEFTVRSGVLLLFFSIGLVYAILLWQRFRRYRSASDQWLAIFMLLCILYIFPWMVGFAGWYRFDQPFYRNLLFYTPFQHQLIFGPVIYFYVKSLLNGGFRFKRADLRHFIPGALYMVWCGIVVITDRVILRRYFLMNGESDPDFDTWYQVLGLLSMLLYLVLSLRYYYQYRRYTYQLLSYADAVGFTWVRNFLLAYTAFLLITLVNGLLGIAGEMKLLPPIEYIDTWWYYLSFAIIYYYIGVSGYNNAVETSIGRQLFRYESMGETPLALGYTVAEKERGLFSGFAEDLEFVEVIEKTTPSTHFPLLNNSRDAEMEGWKEKLVYAMEKEELYKRADLSLSDLARYLKTNTSTLSRVINSGFGKNFNDFVNGYRVMAVEKMLKDASWQHYTIMSVAYEAGFNSKATFNRAFKKITGRNPSAS